MEDRRKGSVFGAAERAENGDFSIGAKKSVLRRYQDKDGSEQDQKYIDREPSSTLDDKKELTRFRRIRKE